MDIEQLRNSPVRRALSPLNFSLLINTQHIVTQSEARKSPETRRAIECWKCPDCFEVYEWEDEAVDCCADDVPKHPEEGDTHCPVCAAECCLWKDIAAPARWQIAAAVESGASWIDAIASKGVN
jgi:hypothetical protein